MVKVNAISGEVPYEVLSKFSASGDVTPSPPQRSWDTHIKRTSSSRGSLAIQDLSHMKVMENL